MPGDALDHLLDHPVERDVFRDVDTNMDVPVRRKTSTAAQVIDGAFGLGIDEEVKISKRRKPVAKLDENRYAISLRPFASTHEQTLKGSLAYFHKLGFPN